MGNDLSHLSGIDIEEKAVEIADFWSQHSANLPTSQNSSLTVFIGELFVNGPLWTILTPLEKCSKNLMIYRHPCILKYISSWSKSSKFYLVVEHVKPLSHVLSSLNTLQLCIGLHSVLKSLCFLHSKASTTHNNVCLASIYVTDDGNWKLGGMEFACKYDDLTKDFLNKSKANRYRAAIDVNEEDCIKKSGISKEFIDTYAFFILVNEVLKIDNSEIQSLKEFKKMCKDGVETIDVNARPKLADLLDHTFFNHEFITIHSFLVELPLKSDEAKLEFFSSLVLKLKNFDENLVASQLGSLLLSRMVMLNSIAQKELLPRIFSFKQTGKNEDSLFSEETFKKYLVPRLINVFCVRDAQIRLLLLSYFKKYIHAFSEEELQSHILPELLVGIKDTDDVLVSTTLQALSDLVLILGADTVIGGKRAKLFTDGRPTNHNVQKLKKKPKRTELSVAPSNNSVLQEIVLSNLPERPRPDGEEFDTSTDEIEQSVDEELDWEDWDANDNSPLNKIHQSEDQYTIKDEEHTLDDETTISVNIPMKTLELEVKRTKIRDIDELDIKNQKTDDSNDGIDFFEDMEPKIESLSKFTIQDYEMKEKHTRSINKLNCESAEFEQDGWEDEDWG